MPCCRFKLCTFYLVLSQTHLLAGGPHGRQGADISGSEKAPGAESRGIPADGPRPNRSEVRSFKTCLAPPLPPLLRVCMPYLLMIGNGRLSTGMVAVVKLVSPTHILFSAYAFPNGIMHKFQLTQSFRAASSQASMLEILICNNLTSS